MKSTWIASCAILAIFTQLSQAAPVETIYPSSMFTARLIGGQNVIVSGIPEGTSFVDTSVEIKERTSDRGVIEFDVRGRSMDQKAQLTFALTNLDDPSYTSIYLYSFKGNGLTNAADYFKTEKLITTFSDFGVSSAGTPPYFNFFSFDVTQAYNQAIVNGDDFLGFLVKNTTAESQYARYRIISGAAPQAELPSLTVGIPEPATAMLSACGLTGPLFSRRLRRQRG